MKLAFKISILINCFSVGTVVFLCSERPKTIVQPARPLATEPSAPEDRAVSSSPQAVSSAKPEPFQWSQIESTDYRVYIANLRGIGCPEQTVRDIITADVDAAIFAPRRQQLKQNQNYQSGGLEAELQGLNTDELAMIATLLGTQPQAGEIVADNPPRSRPARKRNQDAPVAMPVVFQDANLAGLKLNDNQIKVIEDLRQSFVEQIGGPNQDPNDPAYRERWRKAQPAINDELEAMLGRSVYQTLQFEAQSAAISQAAQAAKP